MKMFKSLLFLGKKYSYCEFVKSLVYRFETRFQLNITEWRRIQSVAVNAKQTHGVWATWKTDLCTNIASCVSTHTYTHRMDIASIKKIKIMSIANIRIQRIRFNIIHIKMYAYICCWQTCALCFKCKFRAINRVTSVTVRVQIKLQGKGIWRVY